MKFKTISHSPAVPLTQGSWWSPWEQRVLGAAHLANAERRDITRANRHAARALEAMDERMLDDIGLNRAEADMKIDDLLRGPLPFV